MYNSGYKRIIVVLILGFFLAILLKARNYDSPIQKFDLSQDSIKEIRPDSISNDSLRPEKIDSISIDSLKPKKVKKETFDEPVKYNAKDSFYFDIENKKLYLYGNAQINYQKIQLNAAYIEFNMSNETVYACGVKDTSENLTGNPVFKEGKEEFNAHWLRYNFKTKKGFIYFVKTKEGDGTLIGDSTKRDASGQIHLKGATYSTCDLDHPHYYIGLTRAKSVPNDKIVSGPAYLVMADIPLPFILPFGYFPNTKNNHSGFLLPTWGEEYTRGFYLRNGGYYFAFNDYINETATGDFYSKGSWAINSTTNYKLRYRFSGSFTFNYASNVSDEKGMPLYSVTNDYRIAWTHSQDPKANPNSSFNASVNMSSTQYDKRNSYDINDLVTNTKQSSISYRYSWPNTPFSFNTSLNHSQNSRTNQIDLSLPNMSFNMNTIYPFRKEESTGTMKWYENVTLSYKADLINKVHTYDSIFLTKKMFQNMDNGFHHNLPLTANFKLGRFINIAPSLNYDGVLFSEYSTDKFIMKTDSASKLLHRPSYKDTSLLTHKLVYGQSIYPSLSVGYSPKVYGMYLFKDSKIEAIRHVISPTVSFSYVPDVSKIFSNFMPSYERNIQKPDDESYQYNVFDHRVFSPPLGSGKQSANISMGLKNNFEMKYLSVNDTSTKEKKMPLLENLDFGASYNLMADSNKLSTINMSTGTRLWNDKFNIQFGAVFDPYYMNDKGGKTRYYDWEKKGEIARLTSANMSISTGFTSSDNKSKNTTNTNQTQNQLNQLNPNTSLNNNRSPDVNFDIPWSVRISYSWGYSKPGLIKTIINSSTFSGDMSITKKWKMSFQSGYDFTNKKFNPTSFNLNRDLHCWLMTFSWIPFGTRKSYEFTIRVKASILQDLKYTKKTDFRDNL